MTLFMGEENTFDLLLHCCIIMQRMLIKIAFKMHEKLIIELAHGFSKLYKEGVLYHLGNLIRLGKN